MSFAIVVIIKKTLKLFQLVLVVYCPVDIGDTQGTLQARKTCITPYKCPETLV